MELIIKFYSPEKGGRNILPDLDSGIYRPHLLVDGTPDDEYLGVQFIGCTGNVEAEKELLAKVQLPYNDVDDSSLVSGSKFQIREGGKIVGIGHAV